VKERRVGEYLRDHSTACLGVTSELDLDHRHPTGRLNRNQVCIPAPQRDFPPDDYQLRCARKREELGSFLDQAVQRRLVRKAGCRQKTPTGAVVTPECCHVDRT
jgi:hypothetical protein